MALSPQGTRAAGRIPPPRREDDAVPRHVPGRPAYQHVLEVAYRLGRADAGLGAAVDPAGPDPLSDSCRGRSPAAFADHLWADLPGPAPAGVEVNARAWYLAGLADGLAEMRG